MVVKVCAQCVQGECDTAVCAWPRKDVTHHSVDMDGHSVIASSRRSASASTICSHLSAVVGSLKAKQFCR